jgi:hypothetical protein
MLHLKMFDNRLQSCRPPKEGRAGTEERDASMPTYTQVEFTFVTGTDNLRSNSDVNASIVNTQNETLAGILIHEHGGATWDNGSLNSVGPFPFPIGDPASLQDITLNLTSHPDGFWQGNDTWNIAAISIALIPDDGSSNFVWTNQITPANTSITDGVTLTILPNSVTKA